MKSYKHTILALFLGLFLPSFALAIRFPDPLNVTDPFEVFARVIKGLLGIVGVWAFLNFTLAGIGILTSRGDSQKLEKNKENLKWTVVGIALLFASYAIVSYLLDNLSTSI